MSFILAALYLVIIIVGNIVFVGKKESVVERLMTGILYSFLIIFLGFLLIISWDFGLNRFSANGDL
jgi:hypothetical protein